MKRLFYFKRWEVVNSYGEANYDMREGELLLRNLSVEGIEQEILGGILIAYIIVCLEIRCIAKEAQVSLLISL